MDKPLYEGEKSFLVNIWDELFFLKYGREKTGNSSQYFK